MKEDMIFCIYLMSKFIMSVVIMVFVEVGEIELDVFVFKYLFELGDFEVFEKSEGEDGENEMKFVLMNCDMMICDLF